MILLIYIALVRQYLSLRISSIVWWDPDPSFFQEIIHIIDSVFVDYTSMWWLGKWFCPYSPTIVSVVGTNSMAIYCSPSIICITRVSVICVGARRVVCVIWLLYFDKSCLTCLLIRRIIWLFHLLLLHWWMNQQNQVMYDHDRDH